MKRTHGLLVSDSGQVSSWLILAAGLAAAAVAATSILTPVIEQLALNVGVGITETAPGTTVPISAVPGPGATGAENVRPTTFVGPPITVPDRGPRTGTTTPTTEDDREQPPTGTTTTRPPSEGPPSGTTTGPPVHGPPSPIHGPPAPPVEGPPSETPCFTKPACEAQERAREQDRDTISVGEHPEFTPGVDLDAADPKDILEQPEINPEFAERVERMVADLQAQGFDVLVFEGHRSIERSDRLHCQGRPESSYCTSRGIPTGGERIKAAPGGSSWHNYGLAVDLVPKNSNGDPSWPDEHPIWDAIGEAAERQGLVWGGAGDRPHVEYHPGEGDGFASAGPLRPVYEEGGLEAVWEAVGATP